MSLPASLTAAVVVLLGTTQASLAQNNSQSSLPEGAGKALVEKACTACHGVSTIKRSAGYSSPE